MYVCMCACMCVCMCVNGRANHIHMELQGTLKSQNNIEKEKQSSRTHTDFKTHSKVITIKTLVLAQGHIDQWNEIVAQEINPNIYSQLIFHKSTKTIQWG